VNLVDYDKQEYVDEQGVKRLVLISGEEPDLKSGVPLLDLGGLDLPPSIEAKLRRSLEAVGIIEYVDALKPGASDLIAAAIRTTLKLSVQDITVVCQRESKLIKEAGYKW
jgi:hypothetical protein